MISLYSGTPGSGKSFHATKDVFENLKYKKNVICNFPIDLINVQSSTFGYFYRKITKKNPKLHNIGDFQYMTNNDLTVDFLKRYAKDHHIRGKESQTVVVIDECGIMFNSRNFGRSDRMEWIEFLSLHRHYGYDFILISQSDRMIDRQIRAFIEYEHKHRNVGHFKAFGKFLAMFSGGSLFIDVITFYGIREKVATKFFRYHKRIGSLYDSYALYDSIDIYEDIEETERGSSLSDRGTSESEGGSLSEQAAAPLLDNSNT